MANRIWNYLLSLVDFILFISGDKFLWLSSLNHCLSVYNAYFYILYYLFDYSVRH
jgi:hypothetical protein